MNEEVTQHPLNPSDYFTLVMDEEIRREGMPGSLGGFAIELSGEVNVDVLRACVDELVRRFPIATARLIQAGRRFYWRETRHPVRYWHYHRCSETDDEPAFRDNVLSTIMNRCEPREQMAPLEFHLLSGPQTSLFFIRWIHPLCDARGAELILKFLCCDQASERERFDRPETEPLLSAYLQRWPWWQKIRMFIKAKRYMDSLDRWKSIVAGSPQKQPQTLRCRVFRFDRAQSAAIAKQARKQVGMTGTSLYYIGCLMRAIEQAGPGGEGDVYCVPFAFNLRRQNALAPLFGNHVSVLFSQARRALVSNRDKLFQHLKKQSSEAIRNGIDYAFLPVMWAGSWLPLARYGEKLRRSPQGHERSSIWFSDVGRSDLSGLHLADAPISGLFHLCQVTSPPGLALLVCQYDGQLTLSYNFIEPVVRESWVKVLERRMAAELLGESPG
jgi:hypothetical protein